MDNLSPCAAHQVTHCHGNSISSWNKWSRRADNKSPSNHITAANILVFAVFSWFCLSYSLSVCRSISCHTLSRTLFFLSFSQASSKAIAASLHRNVLSWGVWRGQEEKESVSLRATAHSASSWTVDCGVSKLFRTASVPDVVGRSPKTAFSSVTFATRKVLPSSSTSQDLVYPSSTPTQHVKLSAVRKVPETFGGRVSSSTTGAMRVSNYQTDVCRQNPTTVTANGLRQAYSAADGLAVRDRGKRRAQRSDTDGGGKRDVIGGSLTNLSSQPSYRACIHLEVPLRSKSSVVFLDKSLSISLADLEGRRAGQPTLYRSTLSIRFGPATRSRSSTDNKPSKTNEGYRRARAATSGHNKHSGRGSSLGHCRGPPSKHRARKVERIAPAHGVNSKAHDSDTQRHSDTLGLLSFRGPGPSNTKAGRQKENADEAAFLTRSNFKHRQRTSNPGPGMNFITSLQKWKSKVPTPIDPNIPFSGSYILKAIVDKTAFPRRNSMLNGVPRWP